MNGSPMPVRTFWAVIAATIIVFISATFAYRVSPSVAQVSPKLFIPVVNNDYPHNEVFGATVEPSPDGGLDLMATAGASWVRYPVQWEILQPAESSSINWAAMLPIEAQIRKAVQKNIKVILTLDQTPNWALKPGSCGAVAREKFPALQTFVKELVHHYSKPDIRVSYWELWNEPDNAEPILGCWGDSDDPYYGGGYYSTMLSAVYPVIQSEMAGAQVLVGGLLLDCDPAHPPVLQPGLGETKDCKPTTFFEGILNEGKGNNFDGVSFHAYDYYSGEGQYQNPNWNSAWNTTGPTLIAKANYLRALLAKYEVNGKFLINTEVALLCGGSGTEPGCLTESYETTKSYYIAQAHAAAMANNLRGNLWYSTFGWRGSQLIDKTLPLSLRPSYKSFQTAWKELQKTKYVGAVQATGLQGYRFQGSQKNVWVVWSLDGNSHPIYLPKTPTAVYDVSGVLVNFTGSVSKILIYIELAP